jgi:protein-disulfide isomerase
VDLQVESVARCLPVQKYFPFMATVLQKQASWSPYYGVKDAREGLAPLAQEAGLSDKEFNRCFVDPATLDRIEHEDNAASASFDIEGVPTFVINGEIILGNNGWPPLRDRIEAALAATSRVGHR